MSIRIWNRAKKQEEIELVYGAAGVNFLYSTIIGFFLCDFLLTQVWISKLYGIYQSSWLSRKKVPRFIKKFQIPIEQFENKTYTSFNDFFIRHFKSGVRTFTQEPVQMPAFAEARYTAFAEISETLYFPVKGKYLNIEKLLGDKEVALSFVNGPGFIARLCPVDYHRFHFPDDGQIKSHYTIHGKLHSVNPLALQQKPDIFLTNERQISILETKNFGLLAYIEVGALCVGHIVQSNPEKQNFQRGEEKGYFLFGGSTVIVLGQKGKWQPHTDLVEKTMQGQESLVLLGEAIAKSL